MRKYVNNISCHKKGLQSSHTKSRYIRIQGNILRICHFSLVDPFYLFTYIFIENTLDFLTCAEMNEFRTRKDTYYLVFYIP